MRKIVTLGITVIFVAISATAQKENKTHLQSSFVLLETLNCKYDKLSKQFDIEMNIKHYIDTVTEEFSRDSMFIKVLVKDKQTKKRLDCIYVRITSESLGYIYYKDCKDVTSYSTAFNINRKICDNNYGIMVIADLNFDGKDDIALIQDAYVDAGPRYIFFIQNDSNKFIKDNFLTKKMEFFPDKIDCLRRQLITYSPANAYQVRKEIYFLDTKTNKWKLVSKKIIGD